MGGAGAGAVDATFGTGTCGAEFEFDPLRCPRATFRMAIEMSSRSRYKKL